MASSYFVRLDKFEGPLDLLLHLIKVHELDIFDIDILALTGQYLDYLRLVQFRDLTDAAMFMEMAASLCEIKSRQLLPSDEKKHSVESEEEEDPAASLQRRLIEYDTFKKAAEFLTDCPQIGVHLQTNSEWKRLTPQYSHIEAPLRGDVTTLLILYEQMLGSLSDRRPVRVQAVKESVTVSEVIEKIKQYIDNLRFVLFQQLYPKFQDRYELVANILAMLQLVRDRQLKIHQENLLGPIWMYHMDMNSEELPAENPQISAGALEYQEEKTIESR